MNPAVCLLAGLLSIATVSAHAEVTPFPKIVQAGIPVSGLVSAELHGLVVYKFIVPPSTTKLVVATVGGRGGLELYLRQGAHPTQDGAESDHASRYPGTRQRLQVDFPAAGVWYAGLQGADSGYSGVQLGVQTTLPRGTLTPPDFTPEPGIFTGSVACLIKSRIRGTTVRYTLDGSDPDATSPLVPASLPLTGDATVKARAFSADGTPGPVAEAFYQVHPAGEVTDLLGTRTASHLGSVKGGRHLFRVTVEAGARLTVLSEGGKGRSSLAVRHGDIPPAGRAVAGDPTVRGTTLVTIPVTVAGDYFIALDATIAYSGRTLSAVAAGIGPDLLPWADALEPYVSTEEFSATSCEVEEGMIDPGTRRLLRYNTQVRNVGTQDLVMPPPEGNPFFEYQSCHGHYHFKGFAASRLLDPDGSELRSGRKVSFCLLDGMRWNRSAPARTRYSCDSQGIQAGWADVYDSGLPGQWIDIGDLPAGDYQLELTVNPDGILPEANYDNNTVTIPVTIGGE